MASARHERTWKLTGIGAWIACLCVAATTVDVHAQPRQAALAGTIQDESGGALPGATVTLVGPVGTPRTTVADANGRYAFSALPPGEYRLRAALPGFGAGEVPVSLAAGETRTVDVPLGISPFTEAVTVTVTRTGQDPARVPNAVSVVEGDAIQAFQRRASPAEAFAGIPGFFVENRRNFSLSGGVRFAIRAPMPRFGMRGVQIIQDGVPMTMADGTTEPTNIDLASLGRVEVLRGPSSVLYGNSAGGVISLQTEFPPAGRFFAQPDVQWGSYGYQQQQFKAGATMPKASFLVSTSRLQTDGFRENSHADVRRANVVVHAAPTSRTQVRGVFNLYDLPFGESASTLTLADARDNPTSVRPQAITQGWGESTTQQQAGLTLEHQFSAGHMVRATAWGVWRDVWNPIPFSVISVDRRAAGFRSEYTGTLDAGTVPITVTTGFDLSTQHDERAEYGNDGVPAGGGRTRQGALQLAQLEEVRSVSPFVHVTARLGQRWSLTGGARYDRYRFAATDRLLADGDQSGGRTLDAVSPMAGVTFVPSSWLNLYANVATAYQTPTTVELSNRPDGAGGFNEELTSEDLRSVEAGVRGTIAPWRVRFEVATYASAIDDAIVRFQRADEQTYFRNAGEVKRKGLEVLFDWSPSARVNGRVAYTYQHFRYGSFVAPEGDFSNNVEPSAPPHQLVLAGRYLAPGGLFISAQYRMVDAYPVNSTNTIDNWAYQVADLRLGLDRRWKGLRFRPFVSIDNLFGERYNGSAIANSLGNRFFEPAPGREFAVGLTLGIDGF
ncbi:MAG: TonB-dependent receptor [Acidobacteria bacterium]|nr:TonB-dependent receptor [Acidobacteriota bacterium]